MTNFIDRRLNPKGKSLANRQRFIRRARGEYDEALRALRAELLGSFDARGHQRAANQNHAVHHRRENHRVGHADERRCIHDDVIVTLRRLLQELPHAV